MSLAEAVLDMADEMEKIDWDRHMSCPTEGVTYVVNGWAKQLRTAVKAAGGVQAEAPPPGSFLIGTDRTSAAAQHATMIERARQEARLGRQKAGVEELLEPRMVVIVGGNSDGDCLLVPHDMPVGAKTQVPGGEICVLKANGQLHYSEEDTREMRQQAQVALPAAAQPNLKSKETV